MDLSSKPLSSRPLSPISEPEILIVGAGPVGLLLACRLAQFGVPFQVVERQMAVSTHSRAIGIHPPSLERLSELGLAEVFIEQGVKVTGGVAVGDERVLGRLSFDDLPGPFPFALSLPQAETEALLEAELLRRRPGCLRRGLAVEGVVLEGEGARVRARRPDDSIEELACRFLIGCDGKGSLVRRAADIPFEGHPYSDTYVMGDFADNTDFGPEARLFLTAAGLVESFPLPRGRRRWVVRTSQYQARPELSVFCGWVQERTGHALEGQPCFMLSPFGIQRYLARSLVSGPFVLCGDAAHVVSPIGGQGMNCGFMDAWDLAQALRAVHAAEARPEVALAAYEKRALRRARQVLRRAEFNTAMGRGTALSALRGALIAMLLRTPLHRRLAQVFTMRGL